MISVDGSLTVMAADTTDIVSEMHKIHNTSKVCSAALGRTLTAACLMGSALKGKDDTVTVRFNGNGKAGSVIAVSDSEGNVRGCIGEARVNLPLNNKGKLDVASAIGTDGFLTVIKDLGLKEPYIGQTHLVSGEIAEDLTYYFATSEQVPSSVALGVLMERNNTVKQAGGFIIQLMPFAEDSLITDLEERLQAYTSITSLLDAGKTPGDMMKDLFTGYDIRILDQIPTAYHCDCSRERVYQAVMSIGRKDIQEMIQENKPIEVNCHFCGKNYVFGVEDLTKMLQSS